MINYEMLQENFELFLSLYQQAAATKSLPFQWIPEQNQMKIVEDRSKFSKSSWNIWLHNFLTGVILSQATYEYITNQERMELTDPIISKVLIGFATVLLPSENFYLQVCKTNAAEIVLFINELLNH